MKVCFSFECYESPIKMFPFPCTNFFKEKSREKCIFTWDIFFVMNIFEATDV